MDEVPKVGQRVQVKAGHRYHPLTGTVEKVYPKRVCLNVDDLDDPDVEPVMGGLKPQSQWHVAMRVDFIPTNWPYYEQDGKTPHPVFAPAVSELEPA